MALIAHFSTGMSEDESPFPFRCVIMSQSLDATVGQKWNVLVDVKDEVAIRVLECDECDPPDVTGPVVTRDVP